MSICCLFHVLFSLHPVSLSVKQRELLLVVQPFTDLQILQFHLVFDAIHSHVIVVIHQPAPFHQFSLPTSSSFSHHPFSR